MKAKLNKLITVIFVTMSLIVSSTLPVCAEDPEDKDESVVVIANNETGDQNVVVGNITANDNLDGLTVDVSDGKSADVTTGSIDANTGDEQDGVNVEVNDGSATINVNGNISSTDDGLELVIDEGAATNSKIDATVTGNINSTFGAYTYIKTGVANLNINGDLNTESDGIFASTSGGKTNININGNSNVGDDFIYADFYFGGEINANVVGNIDSQNDVFDIDSDGNTTFIADVKGNIKARSNVVDLYIEDNAQSTFNIKGNIDTGASAFNTSVYNDNRDKENIINIDVEGDISSSRNVVYSNLSGNATQNTNINGNLNAGNNGIDISVENMAEANTNIVGNIEASNIGVSSDISGFKAISNIDIKGDIIAPEGINTSSNMDIPLDGDDNILAYLTSGTSEININLDGNIISDKNNCAGISSFVDQFKTNINVKGDIEGFVGIGAFLNESMSNKLGSLVLLEEGDTGSQLLTEDDKLAYYKDGVLVPVTIEGNKFYDDNHNLLTIGVQVDESNFDVYYYVLDNYEQKANAKFLIDGNIKADGYGLYLTNDVEEHDEETINKIVSDVLVTGELSGDLSSVVLDGKEITKDNIQLTVWKVKVDDDGDVVTMKDEDDSLITDDNTKEIEKSIKYIIKIEQPTLGATLSATNEKGEALNQSHDYEYALEGEKVLLKVNLEAGYKLLAAYNGDGEKVELLVDSNGNYYVIVPKGGGIYLSAEVEKEKYHVRYVDDEGNELDSETIEYGETPTYKGKEPTKNRTDEYSYKFIGWEQSIDEKTGEITFKAKYEAIKNEYTITLDLDGGTYDGQSGSITYDIKYGDSIKLPLPSRIGFKFDYWQGSRYEAGDFYIVKGQHNFKAIWKKINNNNNSEEVKEDKRFVVPNTSVKVEIDNKTIDSIEIIIHGLFLATIAYLIIRFDKRRYHK